MEDSKSELSESSESGAEGQSSLQQHKRVSNAKKGKIIINVSDCQYPVVRRVAKELGWKKQLSAEASDWDVCWTDNAVQPEVLSRMQLHQKINHFPGMYNLARKNLLGRALMRMRKQFPEHYDFFPLTWMLPVEYHQFQHYFQAKQKGKVRTFIVKPQCMSQGKGIFLTRKLEDINPASHCVVQRYMHRPYLIDGLKFDLRVYVLVTSVDPLSIYLYHQGLGRFATQKYEGPNRDNMDEVCMHLTNYAINKDNPKFEFNKSEKDMSKGHKRSLTAVYQLLQNNGVDIGELKNKIKDCIVKTMISGLPHLSNCYRSCQPENYAANMCFQLLGFDIMINEKAEPSILEINHTPSFSTDTPLDNFIKSNYIKDALTIMNITQKTKHQTIRIQKEACKQRVLTGKKIKLTLEERKAKRAEAISKKRKLQQKYIGGFERIYPTDHEIDPYQKFIAYADQLYQLQVGGRKIKKQQKVEEQHKSSVKTVQRRPKVSTTPDLQGRRPIAQRKYDSKQSLNLIESQDPLDKSFPICQEPLQKHNFSGFDTINQHSKDLKIRNYKLQQLKIQKVTVSLTPKQLTNNYTQNISGKRKTDKLDSDPFDDREFKSIRKVGGLSVREQISEKNLPREKDRNICKVSCQKQKNPITLNTLLINGIEQQTNFLIGNLKKYVIFKNGKYE